MRPVESLTAIADVVWQVCDEAPDGQPAALMARERVEIIR